MSQRVPPRYRRATAEELAELLPEDYVEPEPKRQNVKRRQRTKSSPAEPVFDVRRWRLPARWRNDKRVGDAVMAKMTRGCVLPGRFDL